MQDVFWSGFADELEKLSAMAPGAQIWGPGLLASQNVSRAYRAYRGNPAGHPRSVPTTDAILRFNRRNSMKGHAEAPPTPVDLGRGAAPADLRRGGYPANEYGGSHYGNTPGWSPDEDRATRRMFDSILRRGQ